MRYKELIIGRTLTIPDGNYGADKPSATVVVELEDGDDIDEVTAEAITRVNATLEAISTS